MRHGAPPRPVLSGPTHPADRLERRPGDHVVGRRHKLFGKAGAVLRQAARRHGPDTAVQHPVPGPAQPIARRAVPGEGRTRTRRGFHLHAAATDPDKGFRGPADGTQPPAIPFLPRGSAFARGARQDFGQAGLAPAANALGTGGAGQQVAVSNLLRMTMGAFPGCCGRDVLRGSRRGSRSVGDCAGPGSPPAWKIMRSGRRKGQSAPRSRQHDASSRPSRRPAWSRCLALPCPRPVRDAGFQVARPKMARVIRAGRGRDFIDRQPVRSCARGRC